MIEFRVIAKLEDALDMVPQNDAEHMKLIGNAMFNAANVEIFGPVAAVLLIALFVVLVRRRKKA